MVKSTPKEHHGNWALKSSGVLQKQNQHLCFSLNWVLSYLMALKLGFWGHSKTQWPQTFAHVLCCVSRESLYSEWCLYMKPVVHAQFSRPQGVGTTCGCWNQGRRVVWSPAVPIIALLPSRGYVIKMVINGVLKWWHVF